jgi:hypothetical protein
MNALLSRSGIFFLMNSRSDGRISSAIIPLFGDFDSLQIWQTSGALLIGIAAELNRFYTACRFRFRSGHSVCCPQRIFS